MTTLVEWLVTFGTGKLLLFVDPLMCRSSHVFSNHHSDWMSFDICSRQMASLLLDPFMCLQITNMVECLVTFRAGKWHLSCKSFHVSSNHHSGWMTCYIWSRQMASLQCGTFHVALNDHFGWMTCHIWNRQMAFLCGSSHVSLNHHFD